MEDVSLAEGDSMWLWLWRYRFGDVGVALLVLRFKLERTRLLFKALRTQPRSADGVGDGAFVPRVLSEGFGGSLRYGIADPAGDVDGLPSADTGP